MNGQQKTCNLNFRYLSSAVFYSTNASGARKFLKQIILIKHKRVKNPNWPEPNHLAIYKRGLQWTNAVGGQSGTSTWGLLIESPAPYTARPRCLLTCLETLLQNELNTDVRVLAPTSNLSSNISGC